jgi:hypothetical protein
MGYIQRVTLVLRLAGTTGSLLWYAKTVGSQSTGLLEPPALFGGMSELLALKEVTSIRSVGRFLTTSESLPPVIFSSRQGGTPELLTPDPQVC